MKKKLLLSLIISISASGAFAEDLGLKDKKYEELWIKAEFGDDDAKREVLPYLFENKEYKKTLTFANELSVSGDKVADTILAKMNNEGIGKKQNFTEAEKYLTKLSATGDVEASLALMSLYAYDKNGDRKFAEAKQLAEKLNSDERPHIQKAVNAALGELYSKGHGVPKNIELAKEYYLKAIELGDAKSALDLSIYYFFGNGIEKNWAETERLLIIASEVFPMASHNLYKLYSMPEFKDKKHLAKEYLIKAYEDKYHTAYYDYAMLLINENTPDSKEKAIKVLKEARHDNTRADLLLADIYANSSDVKENIEAKYIYKKHIERNDPTAQYFLGLLSENGIGTKKDLREALMWMNVITIQTDSELDPRFTKEVLTYEQAAAKYPNDHLKAIQESNYGEFYKHAQNKIDELSKKVSKEDNENARKLAYKWVNDLLKRGEYLK